MKRHLRVLAPLILWLLGSTTLLAGEHTFGLRGGYFQFPESDVLSNSYLLLRETVDFATVTDFDSADFNRPLLEFYYEWRRDTDAHLAFGVSAGYGAADAMETGTGVIFQPLDPFDYDRDGNTGAETVPAVVTSTLEHTIYYIHITPKYYFTTGKARFFLGGGLGLWANLWRQVLDATFVDIFACAPPPNPVNCPLNDQFRESDGNRRTVVPISISAGATFQFSPHWSVNIEDRYLFSGGSSTNLFRVESEYDISGNQIFIGFSYSL